MAPNKKQNKGSTGNLTPENMKTCMLHLRRNWLTIENMIHTIMTNKEKEKRRQAAVGH